MEDPDFPIYYIIYVNKILKTTTHSCCLNESSSDLFGGNLNHDGRKKSQVTGQPVNLRVFE